MEDSEDGEQAEKGGENIESETIKNDEHLRHPKGYCEKYLEGIRRFSDYYETSDNEEPRQPFKKGRITYRVYGPSKLMVEEIMKNGTRLFPLKGRKVVNILEFEALLTRLREKY